jgi:glyoxylase-like metal-dependent hydrolase (beta-lactamase superfamily II)
MWTAPNPGPKTLDGTHTYFVGQRQAYVIDPGPEIGRYLDSIATWIVRQGADVAAILLTHAHPDHAPGAVRLKDRLGAPILGSGVMASETLQSSQVDDTLTASDLILDGDVLSVVPTPGHSADHLGFFLRSARIFFSGDLILGQGTTVIAPPEGNMVDYMRSLDVVQKLDPVLIAPGHGPLIRNPTAKIEEYIAHRQKRERQVIEALGHSPGSAADLVERIYTDTPSHLHELARLSVLAQLEKLVQEGRVSIEDGAYRLVP